MAQPTGANPFRTRPALHAARDPRRLPASRAGAAGSRRGALVAAAAAWRLDFGVYAAAGHDRGRDRIRSKSCRTRAATVAAAGVALTALVYLPFVIVDGPADAWRDLLGRSLGQGGN